MDVAPIQAESQDAGVLQCKFINPELCMYVHHRTVIRSEDIACVHAHWKRRQPFKTTHVMWNVNGAYMSHYTI